MEDYKKRYFESLIEEEKNKISENFDTIQKFKEFCASKGIQLTDSNFRYHRTIGVVASYPDILLALNSQIKKDKEGLVNCNLLENIFEKKPRAHGFLYDTEFMAMAHPFFRRGMNENANFAPRFVELFWEIKDNKIDLSIALDYNRVRINVDDSTIIELDTWFGAKFNKNIEQISDGTVKLRPPMELDNLDISMFFAGAYSLDISWYTNNGIKTFQAEEFKTENVKLKISNSVFHPVRYLHAEYDSKNKIFRHFDGAIHLYSETEYFQRRDSDFNYNKKSQSHIKADSLKLFKMNGNVNIDSWILFSSHFFTGNPLMIEYFEGQYPEHVKEIIENIRQTK